MDEAELLYEDLFEGLEDGRAVIKTSVYEMEDRIKELGDEADQLRSQVRYLQEQNEKLSKQNEVLVRNISCLFKTAQMEIARKDKQIRAHQQELLSASAPPRDDTHCLKTAAVMVNVHPEPKSRHKDGRCNEFAVMESNAVDGSNGGKSKILSEANNARRLTQTASTCHDAVRKARNDHQHGDRTDELRKRKRDVESWHDYHSHRRRGNERYLIPARSGEGAAKYSYNAHRKLENNRVM